MRRQSTTNKLIHLRTKQTGDHISVMGVENTDSDVVIPEQPKNRHARRMIKSMMRKKNKPYKNARDLPISMPFVAYSDEQGESK
ncbi:hypothetical protein ACY2L5_001072 [Providencia rettgeri]